MKCHLNYFFTSVGLPVFLVDIVLDVLAAVEFYSEKSWLCLGVLLVLLIGSSVLAQLYSWFWYSCDDFDLKTSVERKLKPKLGVLHWFQLGIYVRHAAVLETTVRGYFSSDGKHHEDTAMFLNHDLSMLRIIETFSESAPQIVLMLAVILQEGKPDLIKVLKTVGSLSAVAFCVTTYHRCLRSFLPDKQEQPIVSSIVFFSWNLLLLSSRIVAIALFASVEPCFIFTHFICSWLLLFFFVWRSKTNFMDSASGEWLYRATVGLIWYFSWFNVVEGKTRNRTIWYHTYMLLDISVLCGLWYWKMSWDPPHLEISCLQAAIITGAVISGYIFGLVLKIVYYKIFHPTLLKEELKGGSMEEHQGDEVDSPLRTVGSTPLQPVSDRSMSSSPPVSSQPALCNRRMKKLAENFYTRSADSAQA